VEGAFLHSELYYVGFSVPKLLQNEVRVNTNQFEMLHFTFIGGYVFDMSEMIKFKHSFNARFHKTLPMLIDINASVLLSNRFWIGAMYRSNNSFGFNTNYIIDDKLRIAYSYDFTNSRLSMFSNGTHEIMISYELTFKKDKFDSPRYF
jgi:type IX secretion system PorP/SprF family membrane protein